MVLGALGSCAAISSCASCASSLAPVVSDIRHIGIENYYAANLLACAQTKLNAG